MVRHTAAWTDDMSQPPLQVDLAMSLVAVHMAVHAHVPAPKLGLQTPAVHCSTCSFLFQLEPELGGYQLQPDATRAEQQDGKMLETEVHEHPFS